MPDRLLVNPRAEARLLIETAQTLDTLRVHWTNIWRAYEADGETPPDWLVRLKNARKAQIELTMGVR